MPGLRNGCLHKMKKILLITNIPNPYRVPLFNVLNEQMKKEQLQLKVVFASAGYSRRYFKLSSNEFNFEHVILNGATISSSKDSEKTYFLYKGLWTLLRKEKPNKIIVSGFSSATMMVFIWRIFTGTKYIIWSGSIEKENRNSNILRTLQRKLLCSFASAFVVYGSKAKKYLQINGVSENKITIAINTVDTDFFRSETLKLRNENIKINKPITFTYLGYLVPRKNVLLLLETINIVSKSRANFQLDIIGEGSAKAELEKYVSENNLTSIVKFHGFKQKEEIPAFFAKSNALLFQTDFDIWGLVLNEAMAAGVPCLSSTNAGATYDLIQNGINGFCVDFKDKNDIAAKMISIIDHPELVEKMGEQAEEFIRTNANLITSAKGFINAMKLAE